MTLINSGLVLYRHHEVYLFVYFLGNVLDPSTTGRIENNTIWGR